MYNCVDALERYVLPSSFMRHLFVRVPSAIISEREPLAGSILVLNKGGQVQYQYTDIWPSPSNIAFFNNTLVAGMLEGDKVYKIEQ